MTARDDVLRRIRAALAHTSSEPSTPPARREVAGQPVSDRLALFAERVADYRALIDRCSFDQVAEVISRTLPADSRVVVPDGFPDDLLPTGIEPVRDDPADPLPPPMLDTVDGVITTCAVAIAFTGTVVLDHDPGQGRRALTLVPDVHVCVVRADQVVDDVPAALPRLDRHRPQTWISGPSATSDIELNRVEGVHGPRHLHVALLE